MWIDSKGVAHTVALPEPTDVMSDEFRSGLDALLMAHREQVEEAIEAAEEAIFELDLPTLTPVGDDQFVGTPPPRELLQGDVSTTEGLVHALEGTHLRWRLDVVLAVGDYVA